MREFTQMRNLLIADFVALHLDVKVVVVNMSVNYIAYCIVANNEIIALHLTLLNTIYSFQFLSTV